MVEGTGLENRQGGNSFVGSNPTPSAIILEEKMLKECLVFCLFIVGMGFAYLNLPKFGKMPDEISLAKIKNSPNYKNGQFQNRYPIPEPTKKRSAIKARLDFVFKKYPNTVPTKAIPTVKTDIKSINKSKNVVIWLGHSSYYIQLGGLTFLVDPVLSNHASPFPFMIRAFPGTNVYQADDFPEIDFLIITHDHWDHLDYPTVKALKSKIRHVITPLGVDSHLRYWGLDKEKITEMDWDDEIEIPNGKITCIPARHFSGRWLTRNKTLWASFVININGFKIYVDGDSGYDEHYKTYGYKFRGIDLALLEAGQYNEDWQYIHKSPGKTVQAAKDLKAKRVIAGHNSKFNLAKHPWFEPLEKISEMARSAKFKLITPKIGETVYLTQPEQNFSEWWKAVDDVKATDSTPSL